MDTFIFILEIIGTIAFAASGAMTAIRKNMDIFGTAILGLTTAVGGGVIRDFILGVTPPQTFQNPVYAIISVAVSVVIFITAWLHKYKEPGAIYDAALLIMDTFGLGAFTVTGVAAAWAALPDASVFLSLFVGALTGVGGGVLRDILAGNTPYIFVKHIYACASLLGAIVCVALRSAAGDTAAMLCGMAVVIVIRFLSAKFHWNLPKAKGTPES
jgi:uncharacterized membrane protein YeiH